MRDFSAGLDVDELIGLTAWQITHLTLPREKVFENARAAADRLISDERESVFLIELWGDGHSVWLDPEGNHPVIVSRTGQIHSAID